MFFIKRSSTVAMKGVSKLHSRINMHPNDQMSVLESCPSEIYFAFESFNISGLW